MIGRRDTGDFGDFFTETSLDAGFKRGLRAWAADTGAHESDDGHIGIGYFNQFDISAIPLNQRAQLVKSTAYATFKRWGF